MPRTPSANSQIGPSQRLIIEYWDGINNSVGPELSKKQEPFHAENARSSIIGIIESRNGYTRLGDNQIAADALMLSGFRSYSGAGKGVFKIATVAGTKSIWSLDISDTWTKVADITSTDSNNFSITEADGNLFFVNGSAANTYIQSDGTTVIDETSPTGHLYNSPKQARVINYFKDKLYAGNYWNSAGTVQFPRSIQMSSFPVGLLCLVDGDHAYDGVTPTTVINVTDTKYIYDIANPNEDTLDIMRGGTLIATVKVDSKTTSTITLTGATGLTVNLNSADEIWVSGTYAGERQWRWANNASGQDDIRYDTFRVGAEQRGEITAMINVGDNMLIFMPEAYSVWNNVSLMNGDFGVGCISRQGCVKALGAAYFLSWKGIYRTNGGTPELISTPVRRYLWAASKTNMENAIMSVQGESILCYLGSVDIANDDGSIEKTIEHLMLEYDIRQENWYIHSLSEAITNMANCAVDDDYDVLLIAGDSPNHNIFKFFSGETDGSDLDPVYFRVDTPWLFPNSVKDRYIHPLSISAHILRGGPLKVFVSFDGDEFRELGGELKKGISTVFFDNKDEEMQRCRKLKLSFRSMANKQIRLGWVALDYAESLEQKINESQDVA